MVADGHNVIWGKENKNLFNDIKLLRYHPEIIFIPNLNIKSHIILLFLSAIKLYRKPIYGYLHHGPRKSNKFKDALYTFLLSGIKHIFFLSNKTMRETIENGFIDANKCSDPNWGPDMNFYSEIETRDDGYFISTGKENRDFETLIQAFQITGAPLTIITANNHAGQDYSQLSERCKNVPNIKVKIIENSGTSYPELLQAMAKSKALVCPLLKNKLNYCVGLSTITDAEGLNKPLIITANSYHDIDRIINFCVVDSVEDWVNAINSIKKNKKDFNNTSAYSMQLAYENMKNIIFK